MTHVSKRTKEYRIACFITPHGFGHAARAAAIMEDIHRDDPSVRFEIFTQVPRWFFEVSLSGVFHYHSLLTDIGIVQKTPLHEDIPKTVNRLQTFLPFQRSRIWSLAQLLKKKQCKLILCDISPMAIAVAGEAGIPSVLIENFTWDWIYQLYAQDYGKLKGHISYLRGLFRTAEYHIQTEPVCNYTRADIITNPVSRKCRKSARSVRRDLRIPGRKKMIMITMGGVPGHYRFLKQLQRYRNVYFVIPCSVRAMRFHGNLISLPHHSDFFHPDLVHACDAIIGKLGYSTVAEVYHAGVSFGYITRPGFRESPVLADFCENQMNGIAIESGEFLSGRWLSRLDDLLSIPRIKRYRLNGAVQAARFICGLLKNG